MLYFTFVYLNPIMFLFLTDPVSDWLLKYSHSVRSLFLFILCLLLGLFIHLSAHARLSLDLHLLTLVCRQQGVKKCRRLNNEQPCDHHAFALSATDLHHPFSGVMAKLK